MTSLNSDYFGLKRAVILSIAAHICLIILVIISPQFPKPSQKKMIHYVNVISFPGVGGGISGGGSTSGGGGREEKIAETAVPSREKLNDLTTPQKFQQASTSSLRHPVEKPKKEKKLPENKKSVIQKPLSQAQKSSQRQTPASGSGEGTGSGSGLRIGIGSGSGSGGFGSAYSSQIGLSNFPFTYYLQVIADKISSNWFKSQLSSQVTEGLHTTVYFKIYSSGQISDIKIEESSGMRALDLSALRAIHSSVPFPPLPKEYEEEYLGIHLIFEHSK
ncbi:MAG: TonB C-terminal domain-containing protein [Candidatus Aminicenantes bacterium]|nr:TonB C-terminal domain-containing protein [Candidatus Aminicenantes bacterium]